MDVTQWQQRFERWLDENHPTEDAAHDISHFRRVWMTAQTIMASLPADALVVLTACGARNGRYFAPRSSEAKIVQDADRLEALGAIGLARVFAVSGALGVALFDADDPFATARPLDDRAFALDHFQSKLLRLPQTMQTDIGRELACHNADFLIQFMAKLSAELQGDCLGVDSPLQSRLRRSLPV